MQHPRLFARFAAALCAGASLAACGMPAQSTTVLGGPEPVTVRLQPAVPNAGGTALLTVESPSADSIVFQSANGLDRYWSASDVLRIRLASSFGDSVPADRYATRWQGQLLSNLLKPATITVCRQGRCRDYYHEIPVAVPEANHRSVELTAGYNTVFASRSIRGSRRTVLFKEALSRGIWSAQAEWAHRGWNARVEGYLGRDDRGGGLDLSRVLKRAGDLSYGLAVHFDAARSEWLPDGQSPMLVDRTTYRAGIGPSLMLRGITASSQLGIYADGDRTLQVVSTRISVNGNLTQVRLPISVSAEKTFAFGGGEIVSRRREAVERLSASVHLLDAFALNLGIATHRSAWPNTQPVDDLRATETLYTLGGQYSVSW
jgi:hypothetical protein